MSMLPYCIIFCKSYDVIFCGFLRNCRRLAYAFCVAGKTTTECEVIKMDKKKTDTTQNPPVPNRAHTEMKDPKSGESKCAPAKEK